MEFVHQNQKSTFSHREVGLHTLGFGPALRSAIRQDADVILVGEMRERETISLAMTAAEMGMLVFGTLHTNNAAKTIDRIIDAFPADEQNMVRLSLSESLAGIVSQLLLPTADGRGGGGQRDPAAHARSSEYHSGRQYADACVGDTVG